MALIYTATTTSMVNNELKIQWFNIKETPLAPSMTSYEAEGKETVSQCRKIYLSKLDAELIIHPEDIQSFMDRGNFILTSIKPHPSVDYRGWAIEWLAVNAHTNNCEFRYGGELIDGRVNKVLVSGSRTSSRELLKKTHQTLWPYLKSGYRLVVGDAEGADTAAQWAAEELSSIMEIWFPKAIGMRKHPDDLALCLLKPVVHPSNDARIQYIHRTKEMVLSGDPAHDRDVFLAFWDGQSKGTKAAIIQARKMGYDHGYVFVETANEIRQIEIDSLDLEPWLIVR